MQTTTETQMYEIIRTAILNIKTLAKYDLRSEWPHMKPADRYNAGRALVHMEHVAADPAQYFSRRKTDIAWYNRAVDFVRHNSLNDNELPQVYLIVPSPADLVSAHAAAAMTYDGSLSRAYYLLCKEIMDWEYNRTSEQSSRQARVAGNVEKIQNMADQTDRLIAAINATLLTNLRRFFGMSKSK